jgi:hypothetical protein
MRPRCAASRQHGAIHEVADGEPQRLDVVRKAKLHAGVETKVYTRANDARGGQ